MSPGKSLTVTAPLRPGLTVGATLSAGGERRGEDEDVDLLAPDELAGAYAAHHLMAAVLLGEDVEGSAEEGGCVGPRLDQP